MELAAYVFAAVGALIAGWTIMLVDRKGEAWKHAIHLARQREPDQQALELHEIAGEMEEHTRSVQSAILFSVGLIFIGFCLLWLHFES